MTKFWYWKSKAGSSPSGRYLDNIVAINLKILIRVLTEKVHSTDLTYNDFTSTSVTIFTRPSQIGPKIVQQKKNGGTFPASIPWHRSFTVLLPFSSSSVITLTYKIASMFPKTLFDDATSSLLTMLQVAPVKNSRHTLDCIVTGVAIMAIVMGDLWINHHQRYSHSHKCHSTKKLLH